MAAKLSTTAVIRHVIGDLSIRFLTLDTVADADTTTVAGTYQILFVGITANATAGAANDPAAAWSGNVITFHSGGAWSGTVMVISRVG